MEFKKEIKIPNQWIDMVFGAFDKNIHVIEKTMQVSIVNRGDTVVIYSPSKENLEKAANLFEAIIAKIKTGDAVDEQFMNYITNVESSDSLEKINGIHHQVVTKTFTGKLIRAKTLGQEAYVKAIRKNTIVFGVGPAGTGKTFLAMAMAIQAFKKNEVNRIILTRPAIEAGEKLGFLPGDLQEKVDPYLRPLYDALYEIMGAETVAKNLEKGAIEIAPLAYMRGRTLDSAFIVLDEAQNTTPEQMKMFLTRLGFGSKAVVTGDTTQIDLPSRKQSGLLDALRILVAIEGIEKVELTHKDVVRHPLIQEIILSYEKDERRKEQVKIEKEK